MTDPAVIHLVALTPAGAALGERLRQQLAGAQLFLPEKFQEHYPTAQYFGNLRQVFRQAFETKTPLVAIMATGIVVRQVAPLLQGKDQDPAIVVMDERGRFAISLLSGHLGGANALAQTVAAAVAATPVITTASDVQGLPAIDILASQLGLIIENLDAVKFIQTAWLSGQPVRLIDPQDYVTPVLAEVAGLVLPVSEEVLQTGQIGPGIYVGCREYDWPAAWLRLRPKMLVVGVGCNRGTTAAEILELLDDTLRQRRLSRHCLRCLASITLKQTEPGLLAAARSLGVPVQWFTPQELAAIAVPNPSPVVQRHLGVASVCEAAALKAAGAATLLVTKQKTANVTLAIAQVGSNSSV